MKNENKECLAVKILLNQLDQKWYIKERIYLLLLSGDGVALEEMKLADNIKRIIDTCLLFGDSQRALRYISVLAKLYERMFSKARLKAYSKKINTAML